MTNLRVKILIVFFLSLLNNNIDAKENKILFKINNEIVTTLDIFNEIKYLKVINKNIIENVDNNEIYEVAKNSLIREKIKEIELLQNVKKIEIDENFLNSFILNYFKNKNINSKLEFENYFYNIGLEPENIKKKITIEIMWNQLIYQKFYKNVKIDKDLIKKEISKKKIVKEFLLSEIVFNLDKSENLTEKYEKIKKNINTSSFTQAALLFSTSTSANNGGELGWIKETALNNKIKKEINLINVGEFTKPIIIPGGFLILKIKDQKETKIEKDNKKEFDFIVKKQTNDQLNQFSNIYFNKIKKNIQINEL